MKNINLKLDLSSQIKMGNFIPGCFKPSDSYELSMVTRFEKLPTKIYETADDAARKVAESIKKIMQESLKSKTYCVMALPGGHTPRLIYEHLVEMHKSGELSFSNAVIFNLCEYYPILDDSSSSNMESLHEMLLDHIDINPNHIFNLSANIPREGIQDVCNLYEQRIDYFGGLDIALLGIGKTGNIAFNGPGSRVNSKTRLVLLDSEMRKDALRLFGNVAQNRTSSLTLGMSTILEARNIFLTAWGDEKADIIKRTIEEKPNNDVMSSYLQTTNNNVEVFLDLQSSAKLTRMEHPWLVTSCKWTEELIRSAIVWLCGQTGKPILKLTDKDYRSNGLEELLAIYGSAYNVNIMIFNDLQHTITGWPGGKPNADDTYRPERAKPYPKRIIVFSPHPDDDVISMGGTLRRLIDQKHDLHVAYETSGNIAVGDEEVVRFLHFINGFNQIFMDNQDNEVSRQYKAVRKFLNDKKENTIDTRDILTIKGLIRRGEARTAATFNNLPLSKVHFLDLPFYETGRINKKPLTIADVKIVYELLKKIQPHQIYVAGDLADPHGTHKVATNAVLAALDLFKQENAEWLKDCRIWMYRGAWAEWDIEHIEMAVPLSPEELRNKRNAIIKHQSQMESAPFLGNDERLFWQRAEDRNRNTADLYLKLGLASYEAMEAFVEYKLF